MNQPINVILSSKAFGDFLLVLMDSTHEIVCDANLQCSANFTGENIDPITTLDTHAYHLWFWIARLRGR